MAYEYNEFSPEDQYESLIQAVRKNPAISTPTQGTEKKPSRRQQAWDYMQQANQLASRPIERPDVGGDIAAGMALQSMGGRAFSPMGGQVLKQALAARAPTDPLKLREMEVQNLQRSGALLESQAQHEEAENWRERTAAESERTHRATEAARAETARQHAENLKESRASRGLTASLARERFEWEKGKDKFQLVKGADGEVIGSFNPATNEFKPMAGASGIPRQQMDVLPKAATTEEKNKYATGAEMIDRGTRLIADIDENKDAFGMIAGGASQISATTGIPIQRAFLTPEQIQLRSGVYQQAYETINKLAGAAFSATEAGRIMQFVPNPRDDPETIQAKLRSAIVEANSQRSTLQRRYGVQPPASSPDVPQATGSALPRATAPRGDVRARVNAYKREP